MHKFYNDLNGTLRTKLISTPIMSIFGWYHVKNYRYTSLAWPQLYLIISCSYIIVTWIKDNVPIGEDSSIYQFMQVDNKYRMKILRAGHDDIGQYVVEAKDSSGVQVAAAFSVNLSFLSEWSECKKTLLTKPNIHIGLLVICVF